MTSSDKNELVKYIGVDIEDLDPDEICRVAFLTCNEVVRMVNEKYGVNVEKEIGFDYVHEFKSAFIWGLLLRDLAHFLQEKGWQP